MTFASYPSDKCAGFWFVSLHPNCGQTSAGPKQYCSIRKHSEVSLTVQLVALKLLKTHENQQSLRSNLAWWPSRCMV